MTATRRPPSKDLSAEPLEDWCKRVGIAVKIAYAYLAGQETALAPWVRRELERRRPEENEC